MAKNEYGKSKPAGSGGYKVLSCNDWSWEILKLYKAPAACLKDPYARAFCNVKSPFVPGGEMGDVYVKDIPGCIEWLRSVAYPAGVANG